MKRRQRLVLGVLLLPAVLGANALWGQKPATAKGNTRPMQVQPLAPEMERQFLAFHRSLQPSARSWVERQALIEARRSAPDLAALRTQIRSRFAASFRVSKAGSGLRADQSSQNSAVVDAMAFTVMVEAANNMDHDLRQMAARLEAATAAKEQLRDLQAELSSDLASSSGRQANRPCHSSACQSLVERLGQIGEVAGRAGHPFRVVMRGIPTYAQLPQIMARMRKVQDKMNGFSQQQQTQLQMLMDKRSRFEVTLSGLLNSQQPASAGIVSNMR
jgi:hypothetical protein